MASPARGLVSLVMLTMLLGCSGDQQDDAVFVDVSEEAGLGFDTRTYAADVGDFNGDGAPDLVVTFHSVGHATGERQDVLYRNVDGVFEVHQQLPRRDRHDCTFGDPNGDRKLDLYCTMGGDVGRGFNPNELWLQQADGTFVEVAEAWGVTDVLGRGRQATFLDVNGDGWQDLFVGNKPGREDGMPSNNRLFLNEEGMRFRSAPEYGMDTELGGELCAEASDVPPGGGVDLLVCAGMRDRGLRLFTNQGGRTLRDETERWGLSGIRGRKAIAEDLNGDGEPELVIVTSAQVAILAARNGSFEEVFAEPASRGQDVALGDVDGDGDLDLYVLRGADSPCMDHEADTEWDDQADFILTRDGEDLSDWTRHEVPHTGRGCGDVVLPLDHDGDDRAAFLVLNGDRRGRGPLQLIAAAESPPG